MAQEILVNVTPKEVRVALLENASLQEIYIERSLHHGLLGNIYKGRVSRLLPGIQSAFIDIGLDKSAFLHVSDMLPKSDDPHFVLPDIRTLITSGQEILVQVYKDPLGSKGARLTTQFTIPSRYLVLTPNIFHVSISQKIKDELEKERLMTLTEPGQLGGYIFRTAAEGVQAEQVNVEKIFLDGLWTQIVKKAQNKSAIHIIYEEIPIVLRVLRDLVGYDVEKIRVDDATAYQQMLEFAGAYLPHLVPLISYHTGNTALFDQYSVETELQKALERKVFLKSGGHLVFDQTEAMTTIDVNTGSYVGNDNLHQTIFKTNLEAVDVIARQVRLRNLGGIIIIDFIDMTDSLHQTELIEALTHALAKDSAKHQISELSSLGIVQMTRKRTRESLEHILCQPCPLCQKRGSIKSITTVCYEIFRDLLRVAQIYPWPGFTVIARPEIVDELMHEESSMLTDLEAKICKPIHLKKESLYSRERFDIFPLTQQM